MLLLIIGLNFVLGGLWFMNKDMPELGILCFAVGIAATHYGWKRVNSRKQDED